MPLFRRPLEGSPATSTPIKPYHQSRQAYPKPSQPDKYKTVARQIHNNRSVNLSFMFLSPKLCHSRKFLSFPQIFVIPANFCHSRESGNPFPRTKKPLPDQYRGQISWQCTPFHGGEKFTATGTNCYLLSAIINNLNYLILTILIIGISGNFTLVTEFYPLIPYTYIIIKNLNPENSYKSMWRKQKCLQNRPKTSKRIKSSSFFCFPSRCLSPDLG